MDPESEKYYMEELEKQHKADLEVKAILQDFEARHEVMATIISDVSSGQAAMATNISDITNRQEVMATDVSAVSARQAVMATNINNITTRQETTTRDMDHLKDDVAAIKDTVNVISANTRHVKETAEARINKEKENLFYPNKGFRDAKVKLQKNRVVVIKGNTGDGKTAIAVQLLRWLSQEQGAGKPLQLNEIKKLDLLAPNLKLITFIDDIFGEKDVSITDVQEWNKRISNVETLFVDKQAQTNFLIITVRNEIYNSLKKRSLGIILTKDNIIDLSSQTYKIAEEKKELLELYKPKNFSWTDEEKTQISTYAPNIGFPQCCQLFYNSEELQKERVNFFENPFHFLNETLSRLKECSALLYLFLNNGMIRVNDLDPNSKKVHETLLEQAFSIKLIDGNKYKYHTATSFFDKIGKMGFIKDCFDELLGFLVKKEKHLSFDKDVVVVKEKHWSVEDVYRFNHDSIYVAVALLYGKVTPIGYIQNCPRKSLSYLTTSETATNMIVISSDHYTEMCERLLREFDCKESRYGTSIDSLDVWNDEEEYDDDICIGSLDVWNDPVFLISFVGLLDDRKIDKLDVLNKACYSGAEECALYLLSEGVKPDKDTELWSLFNRHRNDRNRQVCLLKRIVVYFSDETKVAMLNEACYYNADECALYLLSEGVKPDKATELSLFYRHWNDSNKECFLKKIFVYLNDETKVAVLNKACYSGAEECVIYLLSEGVKPDKETAWGSLINRHRRDSNRQLCLLKKIVVYLNDETKVDVLNEVCYYGAEECALYLLCEGVEPDKETPFSVVKGRRVKVLRKLLEYDVTPTARDKYNNNNVLHMACECKKEEMVTLLCDT